MIGRREVGGRRAEVLPGGTRRAPIHRGALGGSAGSIGLASVIHGHALPRPLGHGAFVALSAEQGWPRLSGRIGRGRTTSRTAAQPSSSRSWGHESLLFANVVPDEYAYDQSLPCAIRSAAR